MNKQEFLENFKNILQTEEEITPQTNLIDIDEWDSLAMISTVAFFDKEFNKTLSVTKLQDFDTVEDLLKFAEIE